jgi:hypothetical protein
MDSGRTSKVFGGTQCNGNAVLHLVRKLTQGVSIPIYVPAGHGESLVSQLVSDQERVRSCLPSKGADRMPQVMQSNTVKTSFGPYAYPGVF